MSVRGHKCTIVTSFPCSWEYSYGKGVRRISLNSNKIEGYLKRNVLLTCRLRKLLVLEKPDILVSFMAEPNFRATIAKMGTGVKSIFQCVVAHILNIGVN